jgi:hypothetical protein
MHLLICSWFRKPYLIWRKPFISSWQRVCNSLIQALKTLMIFVVASSALWNHMLLISAQYYFDEHVCMNCNIL